MSRFAGRLRGHWKARDDVRNGRREQVTEGRAFLTKGREAASRVRPEHRAKFRRLVHQLGRLISDVRVYEPAAEVYVKDVGNMLLTVGPSHDEHERPNQYLVAESITIAHCGGGGR
jgi:hypothetical protein